MGLRQGARDLSLRSISHTLSILPTSQEKKMSEKVALITGITGQDGSYLAELLLEKGYVVHGIIRRASTFNTSRIDHIYEDPHYDDAKLFLHYGDLTDSTALIKLLYRIKPDERSRSPQMPTNQHCSASTPAPALQVLWTLLVPRKF